MKKLLHQALDALEHAEPWLDGLMAQDKVRSVIGILAAELAKPDAVDDGICHCNVCRRNAA